LANVGPAGAAVLENWRPTTRGVAVRGGAQVVADCGEPIVSMFDYNKSGNQKLFAASGDKIFDVSALDFSTSPTEEVTGQTSGYYSTAAFTTSGGSYLYAVNGDDNALLYDGASFEAITGVSNPSITGVSTDVFSQVWAYRNRLFFVERNSFVVWFLPVNSIGGAALDFSLDGIFKKGGYLLYGATWSVDGGDGMDDKCVFVSSEGEIAVYQGSDPSNADDWYLAGAYETSAMLGSKAHIKAGGDLLMASVAGVIPLSSALSKDVGAIELAAVSRPISKAWDGRISANAGAYSWEFMKWPEMGIGIVADLKAFSDIFVVNLKTGAWSKYTGWNVSCMSIHKGRGFFGDPNGFVYEMEQGGSDNGVSYTARYSGLAEHLGSPANFKVSGAVRATFTSKYSFTARLSVSADYSDKFPPKPNVSVDPDGSLWDIGVWDAALFDDGASVTTNATRWIPCGGAGYTLSPQVQIVINGTATPEIELVSTDASYQVGGAVN
jgi:hypothetical protein